MTAERSNGTTRSTRDTPRPHPAAERLEVDQLARGEPIPEFDLPLALKKSAARKIEEIGLLSYPPAADWDDAELAEQAARALLNLLGPYRYLVYLRNGGRGREGDALAEIRFAADVEHGPNINLIAQLGRKALGLIGIQTLSRERAFVLTRIDCPPESVGVRNAWSKLAWVKFHAIEDAGSKTSGIPPLLLDSVLKMSEASSKQAEIRTRLTHWQKYLDLLERAARATQFDVPYQTYRLLRAGQVVRFHLDVGRQPIPWDKIKAKVGEQIEVSEIPRDVSIGRLLDLLAGREVDSDFESNDWLVGSLDRYDEGQGWLEVVLDEDVARQIEQRSDRLPKTAVLRYRAGGDLAQIKRLKYGLQSLERGRSENPRLSEFLFDVDQARLPDPANRIELARTDLLQPMLNAGQFKAVEGALNAPDLFLIQGPPGTGKTTVIAEICYQNAIRNKRTLIASQANLAVDNAMSRLVRHTAIRALRRGHADRVEEEGKQYLEENVISKWLADTAQGCERNLQARREPLLAFQQLLNDWPKLEDFLGLAREHDQQQTYLHEQAGKIQVRADAYRRNDELLQQAIGNRRKLLEALEQLQTTASRSMDLSVDFDVTHPDSELDGLLRPPLQRQAQARLDALLKEIDVWQPDRASLRAASSESNPRPAPIFPSSGKANRLREIITYYQRATLARQAGEQISRDIETQKSHLPAILGLVMEWYDALDQQASLSEERAQHNLTMRDMQHRIASLARRLAQNRQQLNDLRVCANSFAGLPAEIEARLRRVVGEASASILSDPPAGFNNPIGRDAWSRALKSVRMASLINPARDWTTSRSESATLGRLVRQLARLADHWLQVADPSSVKRVQPLAQPWAETRLGQLVSRDTHGLYHPVEEAETILQKLNDDLTMYARQRPDWRSRLSGKDQIQESVARSALQLRLAATDLSRTREALDNQVKTLAQQISQRLAVYVEALTTAVQREISELDKVSAAALNPADQESAACQATLSNAAKRSEEIGRELVATQRALDQQRLQLLEELHRLPALRPLAALQQVVESASRLTRDEWRIRWQAHLNEMDHQHRRLNAALQQVLPDSIVQEILTGVRSSLAGLESKQAEIGVKLEAANKQTSDLQRLLANSDAVFRPHLAWWQMAHAAVPVALRPAGRGASIDDLAYIEAAVASHQRWADALAQQRAYFEQSERLINDWAKRLHAADPRDEADLRQIYIDNANVIGITCVQAGSRRFSEEYRNFDCVIVDEVSKATPPELLLPMLKGAKIVLVGDSRQLPPMIGPEAIVDLAAELEVPEAEVEHLRYSLFRELFESCDDGSGVRAWLTDQYRMHPQIMDAINQFYSHKLVCKIPDPDRARAHGLAPLFPPDRHIAWVSVPQITSYHEERIGTSYWNRTEADIIEEVLQRIDRSWQPTQAGQRKEVGVITFYAAQLRELARRLKKRPPDQDFKQLNIRLGTVDRFQGMERPIVIVSLVRNNAHGDVGFAKEPERVNVAFSRAQELLIIVGSRELFCEQAKNTNAARIYKNVADIVRQSGGFIDVSTFQSH